MGTTTRNGSAPRSGQNINGNVGSNNRIVITRRAAWILSLLLAATLCVQMILFVYHDEFLIMLNSQGKELLDEFTGVKEPVNVSSAGTVGSASNFAVGGDSDTRANNNARGAAPEDGLILDTTTKYSMHPLDILKRAGFDPSAGYAPSLSVSEHRAALKDKKKQLPKKQEVELPTLDEIQALYGAEPRILGLERCEDFKNSVDPERRLMGPAGLFNSATNLLNKLLKLNCNNKARRQSRKYKFLETGMALQVPWGKHNPITWRNHHEAQVGGKMRGEQVPHNDVLPIVMIKDPITWMSSLCRHPYSARWRHYKICPNLVPNEFDKGRKPGEGTIGVIVRFATQHIGDEPLPDKNNKTFVNYDSILDFWNVWYKQYLDADFPRLMIRFEDLLFHAEETVSQVCECGGGTMNPKFRYVEDSAKGQKGPHAGSAGFMASLVTYGNRTLRMEETLTTKWDVEYFRNHVDKELLDLFSYEPL